MEKLVPVTLDLLSLPHISAMHRACAMQVLCYHIPQPTTAVAVQGSPAQSDQSSSSSCSFMQAVDDALPPAVLQHLQQVFRPGGDFWLQHAYGRVGYFSYYFPMVRAA